MTQNEQWKLEESKIVWYKDFLTICEFYIGMILFIEYYSSIIKNMENKGLGTSNPCN
jgi:hypothetical protein